MYFEESKIVRKILIYISFTGNLKNVHLKYLKDFNLHLKYLK